jgi:hypothetical protein
MLALLDRVTRRARLAHAKTETRYALYALRDSLRNGAARAVLPYNNLFDYHDTSFTCTIDRLDEVSLWNAISLMRRYEHDKEIHDAYSRFKQEMRKKDNRVFANYHKAYGEELSSFLLQRHIALATCFRGMHHLAQQWERLQKKRQEILWAFRSAPETSTLLTYCGNDGGNNMPRRTATVGAR